MVCPVCGILAAGAMIGVYQVQKLLGTGRTGYAYLAIHQRTNQPVAIKLLPNIPEMTPYWDAARREVRVTTALRHNAILPFYSCTTWSPGQQPGSGTHDNQPMRQGAYLFALCQYIPANLSHFITYYQQAEHQQALYDRGGSLISLLVDLIQQAGSALSAAHARGISHGALIPGNLLFATQERICIADFGLARLQSPPTPFLPPELYRGENVYANQTSIPTAKYWQEVNPISDQYMFAVLCQQLLGSLLPRSEHELLLPVLKRAMDQRPERRYPSIDLFVNDLLSLTSSRSYTPGPNRESGQGYYAATPQTPAQPQSISKIQKPLGLRSGQYSQVSNNKSVRTLPPMAAGPLTPALPITRRTSTNPVTPPTPVAPLTSEDWEKRGDKLFTQREYEAALQAYHRALEINWGKAAVWMALGDTYFALERYKEALMGYEQAMYLNPDDPQIWLNRGTTLDAMGRRREAIDCYERAEELRIV